MKLKKHINCLNNFAKTICKDWLIVIALIFVFLQSSFTFGQDETINNVTVTVASGTTVTNPGSITFSASGQMDNSGTVNIGGNWTNNANGLINGSAGLVYLNGSSLQTLGGSASTTFYNLTLSNSGGASLSMPTTVSNTLSLSSGIFTTSAANYMAVTNTSTSAVTGYSSSSYINGPLRWSLATGSSYFFPVGDATNYRPFELNSITCSSPVIQVTMSSAGASTFDATMQSVAARNWYAQLISGTFASATVRITESGLGITNVIGKSAVQSGNYTNVGGNSIGSTISSDPGISYSGSSYFAIGSCISNTASSASSTPTLCNNTALTNITHTTTGATGISNDGVPGANGLPTGVSASWAGNTITISGTPSASGTFNYTIPLTGGCGSVNATGTITVNATVTAGAIAADQTICNGATPALLTSTTAGTGTGTITYEWYSSADGYVAIQGTAATYQPPALTVTTGYKRSTKAVSVATCYSGYTAIVTITVNAAVTAGAIGTDQTICNGTTPALLTSTTGGTGTGTITYEWYSSADGFAAIQGTAATYQPPALTASTSYKRRTKAVSGATCYSGYTSIVTITVNAAVTAGVIAADQTICNGATPALLTSTSAGTGTGTITYEWYSSADGYVAIQGTSATYQPPALTVTTSYKRRTKAVSGSTCYSGYTSIITITVNATVTAGAIAADQTICNGATPALLTSTTPGTGTGTITYEWYSSADGYAAIQGTAATYQPPALTASTSYKRRTKAVSGATCYSGYTSIVTITVNAVVTAGAIAADQTICNGATPALLTSTTAGTGTGTITYEWYSSADGYVAIQGTAATYQPPALTVTTGYKRRTKAVSGATCYSGYTSLVTITVLPLMNYGTVGAGDQTLCYNTTPSAMSVSGAVGSGSFTYQWYYQAGIVACPSGTSTAGWTSLGATDGANTATYTPSSGITASRTYGCFTTPGGSPTCGTATWSSSCRKVTVLVAINYGTVAAGDQAICYNVTPSSMNVSGAVGSGSFTYQWYYQTGIVACPSGTSTAGWTSLGATDGANTATYTPSSGITASRTYGCFVTPGGSPTCGTATWASSCRMITVNPIINASAGTSQTICNGSSVSIGGSPTGSGGTGTLTYSWSPATALSSTTVANPIANPSSTNTYTVTVTDASTCTATSSITLTVSACIGGVNNVGAYLYLSGGTYVNIRDGSSAGSGGFINNSIVGGKDGRIQCQNSTAIIRLQGSWTNNALTTNDGTDVTGNNVFFTNGGEVQFIGAIANTIGGSMPTNFTNLTINNNTNSINTTLNQNETVKGNMTLTNGPLILNSKTLTIENSATTAATRTNGYVVSETNAANNNSILQWNIGSITGDHVFPFGTNDAYYIPVTFNNSGSATGNISASTRRTTNTNMPHPTGVTEMTGPGDSVTTAVDRFWEISSSLGSTIPASNLTFSYVGTENTTSVSGNMGVQHWAGSYWNDGMGGAEGTVTGNAVAVTGGSVGSVNVTGITQFSPFVVVRRSNPLPIELLSFTGECTNGFATLEWETATETNNDYFTLERSCDGVNYEIISKIDGAGNSSQVISYTYIDVNFPDGICFYRIKQTDFDGKFEYFESIAVTCYQNNVLVDFAIVSVVPNPAKDFLYVSFTSPDERETTIEAIDVLGKQIIFEKFISQKGYNLTMLDLNRLANGFYYVKLSNGQKQFIEKIVKRY